MKPEVGSASESHTAEPVVIMPLTPPVTSPNSMARPDSRVKAMGSGRWGSSPIRRMAAPISAVPAGMAGTARRTSAAPSTPEPTVLSVPALAVKETSNPSPAIHGVNTADSQRRWVSCCTRLVATPCRPVPMCRTRHAARRWRRQVALTKFIGRDG